MNDNTNILLGGGELLLTHTEDEARFQVTPGSYLLILEIVSRKKGAALSRVCVVVWPCGRCAVCDDPYGR